MAAVHQNSGDNAEASPKTRGMDGVLQQDLAQMMITGLEDEAAPIEPLP